MFLAKRQRQARTREDPPYEMQHSTMFPSRRIPFGASLSYEPVAKRKIAFAKKFDFKLRKGIFMGYHLHSGGPWSGDYLVIDEEMYTTAQRHCDIYAHRVREVHCDTPWSFPAHCVALRSQ